MTTWLTVADISATPAPAALAGSAGYARADRADVGGEVLGPAERVDVRGGQRQGRGVVLHHVDAAQERQDRQAGGMPGGAAGGQHVVGAGQVVTQRDRGVR